MIAWPADYGKTGVMTLLVNHYGDVYQKDLGPKTAELAAGMNSIQSRLKLDEGDRLATFQSMDRFSPD